MRARVSARIVRDAPRKEPEEPEEPKEPVGAGGACGLPPHRASSASLPLRPADVDEHLLREVHSMEEIGIHGRLHEEVRLRGSVPVMFRRAGARGARRIETNVAFG